MRTGLGFFINNSSCHCWWTVSCKNVGLKWVCIDDTDLHALRRLLLVAKAFCLHRYWCNPYSLLVITRNIQFMCMCGTEKTYQFRVCLVN